MRIYIDMDGVLCNHMKAFKKHIQNGIKYPQAITNIFIDLESIDGALNAFKELSSIHDVWILSRASAKNINSYTEKAQWVLNNLGYEAQKKLILCHDKSLLKGDILIDDCNNANQDKFEGEWIKFGSEKFPNWNVILKYIKN